MRSLYLHDDFGELAAPHPEWLNLRGYRVPYAVFENEDDVTTDTPDLLASRLDEVLGALWRRYQAVKVSGG